VVGRGLLALGHKTKVLTLKTKKNLLVEWEKEITETGTPTRKMSGRRGQVRGIQGIGQKKKKVRGAVNQWGNSWAPRKRYSYAKTDWLTRGRHHGGKQRKL